MDSLWDENADNSSVTDVEWSRISDEYTNSGYRDGITAGKEASSQEGFDAGYATVGVPLGHQLGLLRGVSSVLLSFLKDSSDPSPSPSPQSQRQALLVEAQDIASQLARVRFSDIVPRDLEAEQHAREHLEKEDGADENEETARRREMEGIEDMLANLGASGKAKDTSGRPTVDDVHALRDRLAVLAERLGLSLGIDLKAIALPHG
ncbi:hypothetical protein CPB84DRAFT_1689704 [Gymnopilus junonius]|uniref:Protein YAE1 n=1 Tax=Gymnopilus junonius TaxID=109634 RepID=A0A9P5NCC2_GYMJU|nr:hypothetical protein CPB84DRAFT_1689704 [Gymnopilus junonius]